MVYDKIDSKIDDTIIKLILFSVKHIGSLSYKYEQLPINLNPGLPTLILFTTRTWSSWVISMPTVRTPRRPSCPPRPSTQTLCISGSSAWTPTPPRPPPTAPTTGSRCLPVYRSVFLPVCLSLCLSVCLSFYLSVTLSDTHTVISGQRCNSKWNFSVLTEV